MGPGASWQSTQQDSQEVLSFLLTLPSRRLPPTDAAGLERPLLPAVARTRKKKEAETLALHALLRCMPVSLTILPFSCPLFEVPLSINVGLPALAYQESPPVFGRRCIHGLKSPPI